MKLQVLCCCCCCCVAATGSQHFTASASPLLYEVLWQVTKMVDNPNGDGFPTVYDEWLNKTNGFYLGVARPQMHYLGDGSDFTTFFQRLGVTCSDFGYVSWHV